MESIQLPNMGIIINDVPTQLFQSLKTECDIANKARYDSSIQKEVMYSGLTSRGVAKTFYVEENFFCLKKFILDMAVAYNNLYALNISRIRLLTHNVPFCVTRPWINIQERAEYVPNHTHDGILSYVIWINIPYNLNEEIKNYTDTTSKLEFSYNSIIGDYMSFLLPIDSSYEGKIIIFPSTLTHCVYPFYTSNENRISISGNILFDTSKYDL